MSPEEQYDEPTSARPLRDPPYLAFETRESHKPVLTDSVLFPPASSQQSYIFTFTEKWSSLSSFLTSRRMTRILAAISLLFLLTVAPISVWFGLVSSPFKSMPAQCGDITPYSSSIFGDKFLAYIDKSSPASNPFTIDRTFGSYPFWLAKLIDICWDVGIARGMQLVAGWVSYAALSNVLIRATELEPVPYSTFAGLALDGASMTAIHSLCMDIGRFQKPRMTLLFIGIVLSMSYVVALPTLLAAITGYISTSTSVIELPDTGLILGLDNFTEIYWPSYVIADNSTGVSYCSNTTVSSNPGSGEYTRLILEASAQMTCCRPRNCLRKRVLLHGYDIVYDKLELSLEEWEQLCLDKSTPELTTWTGSQCVFSGNETFEFQDYNFTDGSQINYTRSCSAGFDTTIGNETIDLWYSFSDDIMREDRQIYYACYNGQAYALESLASRTKCLPSTDHRYKFGFSTVFTSSFLILHLAWSLFTFALWLEAEVRGALQRHHRFRLSQHRGALILSEAARRATNKTGIQLIALHPERLDATLKHNDATVSFDMLKESMAHAESADQETYELNERSIEKGLRASTYKMIEIDQKLGRSAANSEVDGDGEMRNLLQMSHNHPRKPRAYEGT